MNQKNLQIVKEALFGAKARAEQRDNAQFQKQMEGQFNQQHQDLVRGGMSSQDAINQMKSTQQSGIDQDAQRRSASDKEMNDMYAQRDSQGRASMQSGHRSSYQKPEAARPAPLRGALSANERSNDRIVQQQIAQNTQRSSAPANPVASQPANPQPAPTAPANPVASQPAPATSRPATSTQAASAAAGKGHHTVDQNGAIRYVEGGQTQQPAPAPVASQPTNPQPAPASAPANPQPAPAPASAPANPVASQPAPQVPKINGPSGLAKFLGGNPFPRAASSAPAPTPATSQPFGGMTGGMGGGMGMPRSAPAPGQSIQANNSPAVQAPNPKGPSGIARILGGNPFSRPAPTAGPAPAPGSGIVAKPKNPSGIGGILGGNPFPRAASSSAPGQPTQANSATTDNQGRLIPKTGELDDSTVEAIQESLRKQAEAGDAFSEGIIAELNFMSVKQASEKQAEEQEYLGYLNTELKKMASEVEDSYSNEEIDSFTKDLASFEKAASHEASRIWQGMLEELVKEGADEVFIEGMTKEAVNLKALMNLGSLAKNLDFKHWGSLGKSVMQNLGGSNATQRALASEGKGLGALTDMAGKVVHGPDLGHLAGSRSMGIAEHLGKALPNLQSENPRAFQSLENLGSGAREQLAKGIGEETKGVLDKNYLNILNDAKHGVGNVKTKAEGAISKIHSNDYSPLGDRGGFDASSLGKLHAASPNSILPAQQHLPGALDSMKSHAASVIGSGGAAHAPSYLPSVSSHVATGSRAPQGGSLWKGVKGAVGGGLTGSMLGPAGAVGGAVLGGAYGLGPARSALLGAGGYFGGKKLLNMAGVGGADKTPDESGLQGDRHRILPFMSNKTTGAVGGALLSMMMAREMGLTGPAAFLAPVLGGLAGHRFLPQLMNKWKDPYGSGANEMNPFAAAYNRQNPIVDTTQAPQSYSASLPPHQ